MTRLPCLPPPGSFLAYQATAAIRRPATPSGSPPNEASSDDDTPCGHQRRSRRSARSNRQAWRTARAGTHDRRARRGRSASTAPEPGATADGRGEGVDLGDVLVGAHEVEAGHGHESLACRTWVSAGRWWGPPCCATAGCSPAAAPRPPRSRAAGSCRAARSSPESHREAALVREVAEELGIAVRVTGWLDGSSPIGDTHELTVATAEVVRWTPRPVEHDRLRWLARRRARRRRLAARRPAVPGSAERDPAPVTAA